MQYKTIEFGLKDGVGTIQLNRPEKHNAFNDVMISDIIKCYESINDMEDVRVAVLEGRGKSFCAGADLNYMKNVVGYDDTYEDSLRLAKCFNAIYACKKPTIAKVHGAVIGGGNGLVATCDLVFCDDDTKFSLSEVKRGLVPAVISPYVLKRIGEYATRELMLTGRRFDGKKQNNMD
ncbi:MAG: hypothetical protein GOV02_00145 [Candidatus Aenigmarchaeota archaeon]|nr:hypothetical protein [Candidatus Aenigmarchaeota archaeon]